ncbi:hypothetical protein HZI73_13250 [Vallitalea pronyensis]|uniref:Uncharacterized protein n=1 Tax=Vallitalea pronyensis TaxID=1348613 RepID=A0A8J8MKI0_9FIRM|nr:hypothetical protein [Vallitalea pronyensis]QUI23196.1 hypothetical protein HZI73_13250 [Vallitalea pronyensis]
MKRSKHRRPHHRVGEKHTSKDSEETSLLEFDIKKTTLIVAFACFLQGWLIGKAMSKK